jgi:PIN domain nuclease of toxin-antitoxin system
MADGSEAVLDASAVIALLWEEPGSDAVEGLLGAAVVSAVNWSEVLQRYNALGLDTAGRRDSVEALGISIEDFSGDDAETAARMWASTRSAGLSLADRACLSLARRLGLPVHTADRAWGIVDVGVEVVLIR